MHRAAQAADEVFSREVGSFTPRQYAVMICVGAADDVSQKDIVDRTGIDRSTVSEMIARLVKARLLQRRRNKDDTRAYDVQLTAAGREALSVAEGKVRRAEAFVLSGLRADRRDAFLERLALICRR